MEPDLLQNEAMKLSRRSYEPIVDFPQPGKLHEAVRVIEDFNLSLEQDGIELHLFSFDSDCDPWCGLVKEQFSIFPELLNPSRIDVAGGQDRLKVGFRHSLAKQGTKELDEKLTHNLIQGPRFEDERIHVQQQFVGQLFVFRCEGASLR
jgi:hypothetical protein